MSEWRVRAESRLREDDTVNVEPQRAELVAARHERDGLLGEVAVVGEDLRRMDGTLTLHQEQLRALRGERANLDAAEIKARLGAVGPVCRVPIDRPSPKADTSRESFPISRRKPKRSARSRTRCLEDLGQRDPSRPCGENPLAHPDQWDQEGKLQGVNDPVDQLDRWLVQTEQDGRQGNTEW